MNDVAEQPTFFVDRNFADQARLHEIDGLSREVDSDPPPPELFCSDAGRGASAERVQHHVAFVTRRPDDAFQQRERLLRRVARSFPVLRRQGRNVGDNVLGPHALHLVEIADEARRTAARRPADAPGSVEIFESVDNAVRHRFAARELPRWCPMPSLRGWVLATPRKSRLPVADSRARQVDSLVPSSGCILVPVEALDVIRVVEAADTRRSK